MDRGHKMPKHLILQHKSIHRVSVESGVHRSIHGSHRIFSRPLLQSPAPQDSLDEKKCLPYSMTMAKRWGYTSASQDTLHKGLFCPFLGCQLCMWSKFLKGLKMLILIQPGRSCWQWGDTRVQYSPKTFRVICLTIGESLYVQVRMSMFIYFCIQFPMVTLTDSFFWRFRMVVSGFLVG